MQYIQNKQNGFLEAVKNKPKFYLVTGFSGSGKTTFCQDKVHISIDNIFDYTKLVTNYDALNEWLRNSLNHSSELYLDGYVLHTDPELKKLRELTKSCDLSIIFIYANNLQAYRQAFLRKLDQGEVFQTYTELPDNQLSEMIKLNINYILRRVDSYSLPVQYLCRDGNNQLILTDRYHLINTLDHL